MALTFICEGCGAEGEAQSINKKYCTECAVKRNRRSKRAYETQVRGLREEEAQGEFRKRTGFEDIMDNYKNRRTPEEYERCLRIARDEEIVDTIAV